ncbi:hypothetical protein A134_23040 [Vibrio crassostreae 9CS106]|uniref:RNA polymerase sigma factor 70 region 4 type 2 domain-containing protein n=1 Tax=Vibrio crassostreae 9CS106 TaxID=1191300 RepID=A0A1B1C3D6_9VIBR|nr:hypothetical protein A134_23040 [Vibrio crassostreae 9CS106]
MVTLIPEQKLEFLMSTFSERDLPDRTRKALRFRIINGYTYRMAGRAAGVDRNKIVKAEKKLVRLHVGILEEYLGIPQ